MTYGIADAFWPKSVWNNKRNVGRLEQLCLYVGSKDLLFIVCRIYTQCIHTTVDVFRLHSPFAEYLPFNWTRDRQKLHLAISCELFKRNKLHAIFAFCDPKLVSYLELRWKNVEFVNCYLIYFFHAWDSFPVNFFSLCP